MNDEQARQMVRQLWAKNRPVTLQRLAVVRTAVDRLAAGGLDEEARGEARSEAHKLRGILGTYGFGEASDVMADAEVLLDGGSSGDATALGARLTACAETLDQDT